MLLLFVLNSFAPFAVSQQRASAPNSTPLISIKVTGSSRFPSDELVAATGLKPGQEGDEGALKAAADRLASSGMFEQVRYQYVSNPQGTSVEYRVSDTGKLLPVFFDNFVWMPREALLSELSKREPLFHGKLPNGGAMDQHLAAAMRELLAARGVNAQVTVLPITQPGGQEIVGFVFTVEGVSLPIREIEFPGAAPGIAPVLQQVAGSILEKNYSETAVKAFGAYDVLTQYHMRGYLKAFYGDPTGKLADAASGAVEAQLPITEGPQYRLSTIEWTGNTGFLSAELSKGVKIKAGEPANTVQLEQDLGAIQRAYGTRGYLRAQLKPVPAFDEPNRMVAMTIQVTEGDQYRMGQLKLEGISADSVAALQKLWKLQGGDIFDTSYASTFIQAASRQFNLGNVKIEQQNTPHPETKTVDVVLRFRQR